MVSTQPAGSDGAIITFETTAEATLYGIVATPGTITNTLLTSGGAIPNGTYHYKITAIDGNGVETDASAVTTEVITN